MNVIASIAMNPHGFWLSLGGLLLAAEMLGAGGYLLWSGVAAMVTGAIAWLWPQLGWDWQGVIFAVLTVVVAWLWWAWLRQRLLTVPPSTLNQRGQQLIGQHITLSEPLNNGIGHIRIGDGSWRVQCEQNLPVGSTVEVVAVEGITLRIRPLA